MMAGIKSVYETRGDVELFIDYMDTKRYSGDDYFEALRGIYALKYQYVHFDAIISTDDHALDFLLKYRDDLFPDVPVLFSGLNDFPPGRLMGKKGYAGVYESYDVAGTIQLMLEMHPKTQTIAAITDGTRSGNIYKNLIEQIEPDFKDRVQIKYLNHLEPKALTKSLNQLPENSLVLWAIYLRSPSGLSFSVKESVRFVSMNSRFPTYCVWDVVGYGVVGGKVTDPKYQGQSAARMALSVMRGVDVADIPVLGSPLVNIFDYRAMQRFGLAAEQVPSGSIVMHKVDSFYERYQEHIWKYVVVIVLLVTIIIFLVVIIFLKRKRDKFEGMAMHDQLTGLYNRHYLYEVADQKVANAVRHQQPLSLLVIDVDHFKNINDAHGHLAGDEVLQKIAKLLYEQSRSNDVVARFGGEEFVILLEHCSVEKAKEKAERLRLSVEMRKPRGIKTTVSIGVAELDAGKHEFSDLLELADSAVYQAKEGGRNQVVLLT